MLLIHISTQSYIACQLPGPLRPLRYEGSTALPSDAPWFNTNLSTHRKIITYMSPKVVPRYAPVVCSK